MPSESPDDSIRRIVDAYDDRIVRTYCRLRFMVLRRFLFEIGQYLPHHGKLLDLGCGFGLFALFFALQLPAVRIRAFDMNPHRVAAARRAAVRLGVQRIEFEVGDVANQAFDEPISAAYMLDLIHHIPEPAVRPLVESIASNLAPGGRLLVKDIEPAPKYKLAFTWLLDKLMDHKAPVRYWAPEEIQPMLESSGFQVYRHRMLDYLPYPHILYISTRGPNGSTSSG